jgi:Nuclease-related domain
LSADEARRNPASRVSIMTSVIPTWLASLTSEEQRRLTGLLILAVLLIVLYLFQNHMRHWREGRQITRVAKRLGARALRDVQLPDGLGGVICIDFLVLAADAILVIGVKRYDGLIFGGARTEQWTQAINSRSYKFPNPDTRLLEQIGAVRSIVPGTSVRGLHLFTDMAVFPRDKPSNVVQVKDLRNSVRRPGLKDIPAELRTAWTQLIESVE